MELGYLHGSESNCLPSTAIGLSIREPFSAISYRPCCHCMMAFGQEGDVATEIDTRKSFELCGAKRAYDWR